MLNVVFGSDPALAGEMLVKDSRVDLISFTGSLRGACTIHLALRTAATLAGELLGETSDSSGALNADTAGELCNMIAGSWKSRQPTDGSSSALSAPTIIAEDLSCCPPANALDPRAFRYTLVRTYRFQDHCLRLELAFD